MQHPYAEVPLLLATGQGRSGTTVLTKALAEHTGVYSNRVESNVMKDVLLAGRASSTMPSRVRQMVLPRSQHDLVFRGMLLHLLFPANNWESEQPPLAISTFSAMNAEAAEFAIRVFPRIHFANIVRHGVEVVASRMVHRALGKHPFEEHCHAWAASREMADWGAEREDFTLIRHESLLEEHTCRQTFAELFERAGLKHDEATVDYVLNQKFNQTSYDHESGDQDDLTRRQDRWDHWSESQQATFIDICGSTMEFFGYQLPATPAESTPGSPDPDA